MKRLYLLFLVIVLLCTVGMATADSFTMRNGIQFGMTVSEVNKLETMPRSKKTISSVYFYGYGKIAGIKNSGVEYHFEKKKLKGVEIHFDDLHKKSKYAVIQDYSDINALLQGKYGEPIGNKNGHSSALRGYEFETFMQYYTLWKSMDYEEWLLQIDGGYVKIDHYLVIGANNVHMLEYTFFTEKEVNKLVNDI